MRQISLRAVLAFVLSLLASSSFAQTSPWSLGTYVYDGSGNIKNIGADYYYYDLASRLVVGSADKQRRGLSSYQTYVYDAYGNRSTISTSGAPCVEGCGVSLTIDDLNRISNANPVTNHHAAYNTAGNLTAFDSFRYDYDNAGMMSRERIGVVDWEFVYDAADERVASYTGQGQWRLSARHIDGSVIREVTASQSGGAAVWTWDSDHVFRTSQILASVFPSGTRHLHDDHLGTPRLITDASGQRIAVHAYYPFGDELDIGPHETLTERFKFTGHERDNNDYGTSLDYMHARYYSASMGRFLSIDPEIDSQRAQQNPQMWNRYAYVTNNPIKYSDPTGKELPSTNMYRPTGETPMQAMAAGAAVGGFVAAFIFAPEIAAVAVSSFLLHPVEWTMLASAALLPGGGIEAPGMQFERAAGQLAREISFSETAAKSLSIPGREIPVQTLSRAILTGKRSADPQGAKGAVQITQDVYKMVKRGDKWVYVKYELKIIYEASKKKILHAHIESKR